MTQKKQTRKMTKKHESGRSMIEMVGVLAVMGLITAAAFVLITSAMRSQKLSRADDDVAALAAGVRLLYNNTTSFTGIGSANVLKVLGFDTVKAPYGNDTYTVGAAQQSTKGDRFYISFNAGDATTCAGLAGRTWGNGGAAKCNGTTLQIFFGRDGETVNKDSVTVVSGS